MESLNCQEQNSFSCVLVLLDLFWNMDVLHSTQQPHMKPLENTIKKALVLCLKAPITSSREALEVASGSGIPPIDLRFF